MKREKSRGSIIFGVDLLEETGVELNLRRRERAEREVTHAECREGDSSFVFSSVS